MAGVRIDIKYEDEVVTMRLEELIRRVADPQPALREIGEALLISTRERFAAGKLHGPDGEKWVPLNAKYLARKRRKKKDKADLILTYEGTLKDQLSYQLDEYDLLLGSAEVYAATHQFGDSTRGIPQREFLGLSDEDATEIQEIITDHLE